MASFQAASAHPQTEISGVGEVNALNKIDVMYIIAWESKLSQSTEVRQLFPLEAADSVPREIKPTVSKGSWL